MSKRASAKRKIEWKQSGGYTNIFHFCNHHNISFLTLKFAQIVEARSISIYFFDKAEHFRELSVLGKRTGAAIGLCKSRSEVTGRRRRRKWQRGLTITGIVPKAQEI